MPLWGFGRRTNGQLEAHQPTVDPQLQQAAQTQHHITSYNPQSQVGQQQAAQLQMQLGMQLAMAQAQQGLIAQQMQGTAAGQIWSENYTSPYARHQLSLQQELMTFARHGITSITVHKDTYQNLRLQFDTAAVYMTFRGLEQVRTPVFLEISTPYGVVMVRCESDQKEYDLDKYLTEGPI